MATFSSQVIGSKSYNDQRVLAVTGLPIVPQGFHMGPKEAAASEWLVGYIVEVQGEFRATSLAAQTFRSFDHPNSPTGMFTTVDAALDWVKAQTNSVLEALSQ